MNEIILFIQENQYLHFGLDEDFKPVSTFTRGALSLFVVLTSLSAVGI